MSAVVVPVPLALAVAAALFAAGLADAWLARRSPSVDRSLAGVMARGAPSPMRVTARPERGIHARIRQAAPVDVRVDPPESDHVLDATVVATRRGRHVFPPVAARTEGPLRLGRHFHRAIGPPSTVAVYPDVPAARRLALAVRRGWLREEGRLARGALGIGTDFDSIRDYMPDDEIRQVNWRATARLGRPMSNLYRVDEDRDVVCLLDAGRLMAAPVGALTRLDAGVDAVVALASVADVVGDRVGVIAFDQTVRRRVAPRRHGGRVVTEAVFDLEPSSLDSDFEIAFRSVRGAKRAFVVVFTDLLDEAAAASLVRAVPLLARAHAVVVASAVDLDLRSIVRTPPADEVEAMRQFVALDVLAARSRTKQLLVRAGAGVVEAAPSSLGAATVRAYLRAKTRARF